MTDADQEASGHPNAFVARSDDPDDDALVPLVVLATEPPSSADALSFLDAGPTAAAVVVAADEPLERSTVVECSSGELRLPQLDLLCIPEVLGEEKAEQVADLLKDASDLAGTQLSLTMDAHPGNGDHSEAPIEVQGEPYADPPHEVLVRFLGDVAVDGDFLRPLKPKEVAAVAFIALKGPVTIDRVEDALWAAPTPDSRRRRLINILSQTRAAIRDTHLPNAQDGYYKAGPLMKTDIELFESRLEAAGREPRWEDAVDLKLSALSLCQGEVFHTKSSESDSFAWIEASNLVSHWELRITDLAEELAEECLAHEDVRRAIAACEAGLHAMPTHTNCTEALMRAHAQAGDLVAVRHVYKAHVTALDLIRLDQPASSTSTLYNQLMASA